MGKRLKKIFSCIALCTLLNTSLFAQQTVPSVTGIVRSVTGDPLPYVTIKALSGKRTVAETVSDTTGKFKFASLPESTLSFEFTSVGYTAETLTGYKITNGETTSMLVDLQLAPGSLEQVVVVGYGKQSKRKVTSAVTSINTDNFKDAPYTDIQSAIAGRAAGVVVNFSGGEPGSVPSLTIRGGEPLIGQSSPLYVIDGIVRDQGAFTALNVNDIEDISFLKDASATAVYGARAAAGIVLVTTKSGIAGKPVVTYSNNLAWNTPTYFPKLISSYDKALAANAIGESVGNGKFSAYTQDQLAEIKNGTNPDTYPNINWYNLAFRKYGLQQSHNLSLSGGSNQTKYYMGLGYFNQGSNYVNNSFKVQRFSYNTKVTSNFAPIGLSVKLGLNGYYDYSTQPPASSYFIFGHIVSKSPLESPYNKDGTFSSLADHPLAEIYSPGYARNEIFFNDGNLTFTWDVPWVKGLSFKALGDYAFTQNPSKVFSVLATQYNADSTIYNTSKPSLSQSNSGNRAWDVEFQADYSKKFEKHSVQATLVSVTRGGNENHFSAYRSNFPSVAIDQMFAGDASTQTNSGSASQWGEMGYVGRIKYDYAAKYLLELSGRYDGSDYFPPSKRFGFFPAVSVGWVLSSEGFYQKANLQKVFSYFKLKSSYGEIGSIGGTKYAYIPQYGVNTQVFVADGDLQNGYYEGRLTIANQNISWYSTQSRDFGFEFEALNKKLTGGLDYFYTRTTNILGSPAYHYTAPLGQNLPQVLTDAATRKEGIDATLNINWRINRNLNGYIGFNCTYFNYLWEKTNEDSAQLINPYTRTQGVNQDYYSNMYTSLGLYQDYNEILNNPSRITSTALSPGDVWLQDRNGDGKIDAQDLRRLGESQSPHFTFGVPFGIVFKGIRLDALIQGTGLRDVYLGNSLQAGEGVNRINFGFQKDYWLPGNADATFPRAGNSSMNNNNNYQSSTFWLKDAQFVRLKSLTLSYDFKRALGNKIKFFNELSVNLSGTNLLTFSPVKKYFDPELANNNNFFYPVNRTYSVGIRFAF
jgi:TonB-linked SusC/RagA family outer membrane protein